MPELNEPAHGAGEMPDREGLPVIAPDTVEQEQGSEMDNIVPTRGYQMQPVVALGGSAGSIPALQRFFTATPPETGMAFVVVLHLAPDHESIIDEILARSTSMPVVQAEDGQKVEANRVYVIPPGKFLSAANGRLRLTALEPERGKQVAVDLFFRTLADTHGPTATAIILSGADGDGALGIKRIKERGGLTVAQDPEEADHPSMPRSAIDTGMVDWVLPVAEMPQRLIEYRANGKRLQLPSEEGPQPAKALSTALNGDENALRDVLAYLRSRTGRDFSYYKRATIVRRISRRMQVNGVETVADYLGYLRTHPGEAGALQQDLLISVTNFFRDRDSFEALEREIPAMFAGKGPGDVVRAWIAGCATGEEAYSVAMLLLEQAARMDAPPGVQVFGTDLAEEVITAARDGLFPFTIQADVSEGRLRRFFVKEHRGFRARRELRECVLFAVHDLLRDAPFSRLDLFTCRNLLIYLNTSAQNRVLETAHFALRPEGRLFIGSSESVDEESPLWTPIDKKHRIYRQRPVARVGLPVPIGPSTLQRALNAQERAKGGPFIHGQAFSRTVAAALANDADEQHAQRVSWEELHFKMIERFAPPSVIVTRDHEIVHMSENAGRFLHFSSGEPSVNLLKVVHPMLRVELRAALLRAAQTSAPVQAFRVPLELDGKTMFVDLRVVPAQEIAPDYLLVVFAPREAGAEDALHARQEAEPAVRHLEREMEQIKAQLRDTVEQYEASCEELKASNKELQAMNGELRSSAEELEISREELQSVNEELTTVNQELKSKVEDLGQANADLANLMAATGVATIFLDRTLRITRYTPSAVTLFRLIPSDLGRPLTDLTHRLNYPDLKEDAAKVLETLVPVKREVSDGDLWFLAQLLPYRAADDHIAGVVLTFVDITEARKVSHALAESEKRLRTLADAVPQIIWANDAHGEPNYFNRRWYDYTGLTPEQSIGLGSQAVLHPEDELASTDLWRKAQAAGEIFDTEYRLRGKEGGYRWFIGRNVPMRDGRGRVTGWFGTATDIQELKEATKALALSEERFRSYFDLGLVGMAIVSTEKRFVEANDELCRMLGYSRAELVQRTWVELTHPDDVHDDVAACDELSGGPCDNFTKDRRFICQDGRVIDATVAVKCVRGADGSANYFMALVQDVTAQKRIQEALAASQERLRLIVENAREYAIFSLDVERRVTSWNVGAERLLGWKESEIVGNSGDLIFTPEDVRKGAPAHEASMALREGKAIDERWHVRKDGSRFWGSGVMMAMHDANGHTVGLVKIFRDQTEVRETQQALEQSREDLWAALQETERARAEAEAAGRAKDHFLAVLSHELRTPLTPVLMAVQALSRLKDLPPAVADALDMIRRNIQVEAHFIDDLLDLTRLSHGKIELIKEPMDLHLAIRHAVEVSQPDIQAKNQQLTVSLDAKEFRLHGDVTRLQQVIWNLLKNASKFTPEGGWIRVSSRNEPGVIVVQIADSGMGFPPGDAARIMDAFTQGDESVTRQFGGLGLGLAISKATVDAQGGTLSAESPGRGRGATFTVELPLSSGAGDVTDGDEENTLNRG